MMMFPTIGPVKNTLQVSMWRVKVWARIELKRRKGEKNKNYV